MPETAPSAPHVIARLREAFAWRRAEFEREYRGWVIRRSSGSEDAIRRRWPWPLRRPWQSSRVALYSFGGGIGDELMCTPVFRAIKRANPECQLTFITRYPELFRENPHLDAIEPLRPGVRPAGIALTYGPVHPPPRPLVTMLGECVGLILGAEDLESLNLPPTDPELAARLPDAPRRIVVQPMGSQWTPNKAWPLESWRELVATLAREFQVIEVGTHPLDPGSSDFGPHFHSFAGATDLVELAQVIRSSDVFVGPVSGGMHLANALRVPSVIIYGGYESPTGHAYSQTTSLYSQVPCAPCWLPADCPHERKCLRMITPAEVAAAIRARLRSAIEN